MGSKYNPYNHIWNWYAS